MKKEGIVKIIVLIIVITFIAGMFVWFSPSKWQSNAVVNKNGIEDTVWGYAEFNGTLAGYMPYLIIKQELNKSIEDGIKANQKVESITKSAEGVVVSLKKKDDVIPVYDYLKSMNVTSFADAEIELPYVIELHLGNGSNLNITTSSGRIGTRMEPFTNPSSKVRVKMVINAENGVMTGYQSFSILPEKTVFSLNATVKEINAKIFVYSIPWDMRNSLNMDDLKQEFGDANIKYTKNSSITFSRSLNVSEIQERKNLSYITFIASKTAIVNESFSNKTAIESDFWGIAEFPYSILEIEFNETKSNETAPLLGYNMYNISEFYYYTLNSNGAYYDVPSEIIVKTFKVYNIGDNVTIDVDALVVGQHIINIVDIKVG